MAEGDFVRNYFRVHNARSGEKEVDTAYSGNAYDGHYGADALMAEEIVKHIKPAARVVYAEVVSYEVAFRHAVGAHDTETAELIRHIQIGVEGQRRAAFVLNQGCLVVDNIGIAVEHRIGARPAAGLHVIKF